MLANCVCKSYIYTGKISLFNAMLKKPAHMTHFLAKLVQL